MEVSEHKPDQKPWKILGQSGSVRLSVAATGSLKVEIEGRATLVPIEVVWVLQNTEAIAFVKDPAVAPFFYAASDRDSRVRAARLIASQKLSQVRRECVARLVSAGASESEAWLLACQKHPLDL